jgi:membrane protein involved in colicin uptake
LKQGKIGAGSYVPNGLTAAQYQKVRDQEASKKKSNYERNVKKAGVYEDYTEFYVKRGTDTSQKWYKSVTRGHRMAKLKYDIESENTKKYDGGLFAKKK